MVLKSHHIRAGEYVPILAGADAILSDILNCAETFAAASPALRKYAPHKAVAYVPVDPALIFSGVYGALGEEIDCLSRMNGTNSRELIARLQLTDLTPYPPDELSCGQSVRAAIGVAAASHPSIWVLDRCFEWLEEGNRQLVANFLREELRSGKPIVELSAGRVWLLGKEQVLPEAPAKAEAVGRTATGEKLVLQAEKLLVRRGRFKIGPLDLQLFEGEALAVVGPNGAGKTTVALALAGLLEFEGKVEFRDDGSGDRWRVLYAFQKPDDQFFRATVREELTECMRRVGSCDMRRAEQIARALRIDEDQDADPFSLPLSERRLLTIASVLSAAVPVVILDEPSAFLSPAEVHALHQAINVARAHGTAVIAITHDHEFASAFADRTLYIEATKYGP